MKLSRNKVTGRAFAPTGLDQLLRSLEIDGLVLVCCGNQNPCVGMAACDADRGYNVVMVEDAMAAPSPILDEAALLNFAYLSGHVRTTKEVPANLGLMLPLRKPAAEVSLP